MLLLGRAGGGKSYVVDAIMSSLSEAVTRVKLMATTGKAGFIIGGSTVHSWKLGLALPTGKMAQIPLKNPYLIAFQERLQFTNTLILDEFSMLSLMMLYWMDQRCRQAKPHNAHLPFGGMNVILIGDIGQLPPVIPYCLWSGLSGKKFKEKQASMIYHLFDTVVILQVNNRQAEPVFRGILDRLYDGETTKEDWVLLQSRSRSAIPNWETTFGAKDTVHLHVRNKDVLKQNLRTLQSLNKPIARFNADHASAADKGVEGDKAMDLQPFLYLCKGAQVLHTTNTCQPWGLCNGAVGTVVDFIMGEEGPPALPLAVIVDFGEYYIGPPLFGPDEPASAENPNPVSKKGWVSIEPITAEWSDDAKAHSRTMLPLKLSWAWTVWKAQGQTLTGRLVLHLGDTEKTAGIAYTAMSRATRLENIAHYGITLERLTTMIPEGQASLDDDEKRTVCAQWPLARRIVWVRCSYPLPRWWNCVVACNSRGHRRLRMCWALLLGVAEAGVHLRARLGVGPEAEVRCVAAPAVVVVEEPPAMEPVVDAEEPPEEPLVQRGADEAETEGSKDGLYSKCAQGSHYQHVRLFSTT